MCARDPGQSLESNRRVCRTLLVAILAWVAAGCTSTREINLWPLVQVSRDPVDDFLEIRALGPLVRFRRKGEVEERGLHPLIHARSEGSRRRDVHFLWPLGRYLETPSRSEFHLYPFILHRAMQEGDERKESFLLFPLLYLGSSTTRGSSFALFPFYGHLRDFLGRDEVRFVLFPFWLTTRLGERRSWNAPWPLVGGAKSDDAHSLKVLPIFAVSHRDGRYHRTAFLWPIFHIQQNDLQTDDPTRMVFLFPLFGIEKGRTKLRLVALWPFFAYSRNRASGVRFLTAPWPFLHWSETPSTSRERYWPLYGSFRGEELQSRFFLWPLGWIRREKTRKYQKDSTMLFPFYASIHRKSLPGESEESGLRIWPLFDARRGADGSRDLSLLALSPWRDLPGFEALFAPLWTLYRHRSAGGKGEAEALLGAVRHRWSGERETFSLPWVYSFVRESPGVWDRSFLLGLVRLSARGERRSLRLLTIPLLRW